VKNIRSLAILIVFSVIYSSEAFAADIYNGKSVYKQRCAICHGDRGKAVMPGTPDLSRQQGMQKSNSYLLKRLKRGKGSCPPFGGILKDEQLNDVISFVRTMRRQ